MSNLFIEFKNFVKGEVPDAKLLVPILIWASGSEKNIEVCQRINRRFYAGNANIYIRELTLHNSVRHIIKYPKVAKDDEKTKFFYDDLCSYFNWSNRELQKNINILDIEKLKPILASAFGYENKQRKLLGLEGLKYGSKKKTDIRTTDFRGVKKAETDNSGSQKSIEQFKEC